MNKNPLVARLILMGKKESTSKILQFITRLNDAWLIKLSFLILIRLRFIGATKVKENIKKITIILKISII